MHARILTLACARAPYTIYTCTLHMVDFRCQRPRVDIGTSAWNQVLSVRSTETDLIDPRTGAVCEQDAIPPSDGPRVRMVCTALCVVATGRRCAYESVPDKHSRASTKRPACEHVGASKAGPKYCLPPRARGHCSSRK